MVNSLRNAVIGDQLDQLSSLHQKARYTLLFNIATIVLILGFLATVISLIMGTYPILVPGLGNVVFALITLVLMRLGKLQLAAKIYFVILFMLLFGNLIFNDGTMHVGSPFWIVLLNIFVFFILGFKWGFVFLSASTVAFAYYIIEVLPHTLEIIETLPKATYYSAVYETVFALFILGYAINIISNANRDSDRMLREKNKELMQQNQIIKQQADDKTIMLKEIHHRVKNNLQVIISLMRLQMRELGDEKDLMKYRETINRVMTMAMIHEKLYQSEELSKVNLEQYFRDLAADLLATYTPDKDVKIKDSYDLQKVGMKTLVPIALIFNELFSNSLKHAFDGIDHPEIEFSLCRKDDNTLCLQYSDNGNWKEPSSEYTFGMELIDSLVDQLEGEMVFKSDPRTHYHFSFKDADF